MFVALRGLLLLGHGLVGLELVEQFLPLGAGGLAARRGDRLFLGGRGGEALFPFGGLFR
jgi:hypothetical protein